MLKAKSTSADANRQVAGSAFSLQPSALRAGKACRGWRGVAGAIGLELYDQKGKRAAQRQAVEDLLAHPAFPAAVKANQWPKAEVQAFAAAWLKLVKKDNQPRGFEMLKTPNTQHSTFNAQAIGDLPAQNGGDGELPFVELTPEEMFKNRLKFNLDIYLNPHRHMNPQTGAVQKLKDSEIEELRVAGLLPKLSKEEMAGGGPAGGDFPKYATSLEQLCNFYKRRWPEFNIKVRPQTIIHWQNGRAGVGSKKPTDWHPVHIAGGRYLTTDCFAWFEKWILPKYQRGKQSAAEQLPGVAENESIPIEDLREAQERREIALRDLEIELEMGSAMKVSAAETVFAGFALRVDAAVAEFIEHKDNLRRAVQSAVAELLKPSPEQLTALDDRMVKHLREAYDALKEKFNTARQEQAHQIRELSKPVLVAKT